MRPSWVDKAEKVAFVAGLAVLAFLYGFATRNFGWPPSPLLERAWLQAEAATSSPAPDFTEVRVFFREGARTIEPDEVQPGLTLISTLWEEEDDDWKPGLKLIDREGRALHEWRLDPEQIFPDSISRREGLGLDEFDFQGSYLFPDGDVLVNIEYAGTVRMDACGSVRWSLPGGNHHSIHRAEDGSFWIPAVTRYPAFGSPEYPDGFPGMRGPSYQNQLMRVSPDGEVLEVINVMEVLYQNGLDRHIRKSSRQQAGDVTHLNDIESLSPSMADEYPLFEAGDLVLSLRDLELVLVVDPTSKRVKWHASDPFILQHDPDFIGDGWIGVFDNNADGTFRGDWLGGSRIVALQPHTDSMKVLFPTPESEPFYAWLRGKWQQLANGNMLLTESTAGRVVEVTPDGRTVWEWITEPYDEVHTPYVSKGERVDLTPEHVASWPCSRSASPDDQERRER